MWRYNYTSTALVHYGVKGMKWGIRKDKYESNEHFQKGYELKKGDVIQNISVNTPRTVRKGYTPIYGAVTKKDKANYKGFYSNWLGGDKIYDNALIVNKNLKVASQKDAADEFAKMISEDTKGYGKALAKAGAGQTIPSLLFAPLGAIRRHSIAKKYREAGEDWVKKEGYAKFNQLMNTDDKNYAPIREKYFKRLSDKGYGAIFDTNDVNTDYADEPIILINPSRDVVNGKSVVLSQNDIDNAFSEYEKLSRKK